MIPTKVFVETGKKKAIVGAVDWPGWCRSGRNEEMAFQTLLAFGQRYARVMQGKDVDFLVPITTFHR